MQLWSQRKASGPSPPPRPSTGGQYRYIHTCSQSQGGPGGSARAPIRGEFSWRFWTSSLEATMGPTEVQEDRSRPVLTGQYPAGEGFGSHRSFHESRLLSRGSLSKKHVRANRSLWSPDSLGPFDFQGPLVNVRVSLAPGAPLTTRSPST